MKKAVLFPACVGLFWSSQLMASGYAVSEQSTSSLGSSYAGSAVVAENASNQWFNPATLASLHDREFSVALHQVFVDVTFDSGQPTGPGNFEDFNSTIGSLYLALPLNDTMTFGLGFTAPYGTKFEYEENWGNVASDPLAPLSPTTGDRYATYSELKVLNLNPALGIALTDRLNLGLGVSYATIETDIRSSLLRMEGDDDAYGWNLGLTYQADDNNHFGLSYRSAVRYKDMDTKVTISQAGSAALSAALMQPIAAGHYKTSASLDTPASATLGYAGDLTDRTRILLGVEWVDWSTLQTLDLKGDSFTLPVEFGWQNTVRYSLGVNHRLANDVLLRAGLAKEDSTQNSQNRAPASPDAERYWLTLGAGFSPMDNMNVDLGYAHIFVKDADVNLTDRGVLNGSLDSSLDIVGAQLSYRF
ncbi:long-chain fatty acid transporter [Alcanivorax hongdengensis A-11-3]|uniref:Long-chain fatty acid transporter n=1 Tax=Alcanivorax hongdengensis A-11-3 TaxID=1177179 RepID=L0WEQ7_9GAMM|nr:OmpP1/FadL family transporter [Alcanivorax hongdengensis]EKF74290.1 long-chain fatty acid transporter [Alcanivorax hongdengensis A-11-3]